MPRAACASPTRTVSRASREPPTSSAGPSLPGLATHGTIELLEFGKSGSLLTPATTDSLSADGRRTELADAVQAARDRYRGRRVAGIVVLSDGAETSAAATDRPPAAQGPPVFAIGIGSPDGIPDREVASASRAGDPRLDQSLVDLHVSTVSHGFGRAPFQLRVLGNGQVLETRRVVPLADGSPVDETFTRLAGSAESDGLHRGNCRR